MPIKLYLVPLTRFIAHLPRNGDVELAILKTHLLIEELLTIIITNAARHPQIIETDKLRFAQKINLAQAFDACAWEPWLCEAVQSLNRTRNKLAHGLSVAEIEQRCDAFVAHVEKSHGAPEADLLSPVFGRFHWAAFKVFAALATHAHFDASTLRRPTLLGSGSEKPDTA